MRQTGTKQIINSILALEQVSGVGRADKGDDEKIKGNLHFYRTL